MFFHKRTVPGLAIFSYMVGDETTKKCAVIDPVRDVEEYISVAKEHGFEITDILETHVHADFVSGAVELKARLGGAPTIHCSEMGGEEWLPKYCDHPVRDGTEVSIGKIRMQAIHTPGHTPEHVMWALYDDDTVPKLIFSGDCLFVGAVGRPDLLGEEAMKKLSEDLYTTVFEKVLSLPDSIEVYPAHGSGSLCGKAIGTQASSTIGQERQHNPFLKKLDKQMWIDQLMSNMPKSPPYFPRMKHINVVGPSIIGDKFSEIKGISVSEVKRLIDEEKAVIIDARNQHDFSILHIPQAFNIPYGKNMSTWAGWFIEEKRPIILIAEDNNYYHEICRQLLRIGFDNIAGYLDGGIPSWEKAEYPTERFQVWSVNRLKESMLHNPDLSVIDVRTTGEWESGHIPGALHIPIDSLQELNTQEGLGTQVALICRTGYRSSVAASVIGNLGYKTIINIDGGMVSWNNKHLPLESGAVKSH